MRSDASKNVEPNAHNTPFNPPAGGSLTSVENFFATLSQLTNGLATGSSSLGGGGGGSSRLGSVFSSLGPRLACPVGPLSCLLFPNSANIQALLSLFCWARRGILKLGGRTVRIDRCRWWRWWYGNELLRCLVREEAKNGCCDFVDTPTRYWTTISNSATESSFEATFIGMCTIFIMAFSESWIVFSILDAPIFYERSGTFLVKRLCRHCAKMVDGE